MTSSNGNIVRVTVPLYGEFTGPGEFPAQRPVTQSFDVFLDLGPNKRLRRYRGHYDVNVMLSKFHRWLILGVQLTSQLVQVKTWLQIDKQPLPVSVMTHYRMSHDST